MKHIAMIFCMTVFLAIPPAISEKIPQCEACTAVFKKSMNACTDNCLSVGRPECADQCLEEHPSKLKLCFTQHRCPPDQYHVPDLQAFMKALRQSNPYAPYIQEH